MPHLPFTSSDDRLSAQSRTALPFRYGVYGISLQSEIPLALPEHPDRGIAAIELLTASAEWFAAAIEGAERQFSVASWYYLLSNGSSYARWEGVGEYLVSADGRRIVCRAFDEASSESFQVYLLGQALSFALVNNGFEPLHATAVAINGEAVAFLGHSHFGKSTLAASFVSAGHRVLTDDALILRESASGIVLAYPGPARIKLYPKMARQLLGDDSAGVPMHLSTEKLILPLDRERSCSRPIPLKVVYALAQPRDVFRKQRVRIEPLSDREAFLELVGNTFNSRLVDAGRLERNFRQTARLLGSVPIRKLWFPRDLSRLTEVREAILSDANAGDLVEVAACGA